MESTVPLYSIIIVSPVNNGVEKWSELLNELFQILNEQLDSITNIEDVKKFWYNLTGFDYFKRINNK